MRQPVTLLQPRAHLKHEHLLTILVPLPPNSGAKFNQFEAQLTALGGWTREPNVSGAWLYRGRLYRDRLRKYLVLVPGDPAVVAASVQSFAQREFQQKAVYLTVSEALVPAALSVAVQE